MALYPIPFDELAAAVPATTQWLWHGYLASGAITLLTSRWKAGKTTLISLLLARMQAGGDLADSAVAAGRAVVVSEEAPQLWVERGRRLGFGPHVELLCRPFRGKPSSDDWLALIDQLALRDVQLTIIDPVAAIFPTSDENNAAVMMDALAPLSRLTAAGQAVLLAHHPRKADAAPRGSGALPGHADILLELDVPRSALPDDRQRWLRGAGRYGETPPERLIELSADGRDYRLVADPGAADFAAGWETMRLVFEDARQKLTRRQVLESWPPDYAKPPFLSVVQCLERAAKTGVLTRSGTGRRSDPFRYWLPEREVDLCRDDEFTLESLGPIDCGAIRRMASAVLRARARPEHEQRRRILEEVDADDEKIRREMGEGAE